MESRLYVGAMEFPSVALAAAFIEDDITESQQRLN